MTAHAVAIGTLGGGEPRPASSIGEPEARPAVVMLGEDRLHRLLRAQAAPRRPLLREASPGSHANELVPHTATTPAPAPPSGPPPVPRGRSPESLPRSPTARVERLSPVPAAAAARATLTEEDVRSTDESSRAQPPVGPSTLVLHRPPLVYPDAARRAGVQGLVVVGLEVDGDGTVSRTWILRSSGSRILDSAAARNVRQWTFDPDGLEGSGNYRQEIRFTLD